jgi:hypothetical protein
MSRKPVRQIGSDQVCGGHNPFMFSANVSEHENARKSLDRAVIGEPNSADFGARPTSNDRIRGLRTRKAILGRIACKGLLVATLWLLLEPTHGLSQASSSLSNLLDPNNGGQVIVATSDGWLKTIDGNEAAKEFRWNEWAIYAFRDEHAATFETFAVLIPAEATNVKDIELLSGNDSPTGKFTHIGTFTTTNARFTKSPYQEFTFAPVTAKYLKVQLISCWCPLNGYPMYVYQFRLFGRLKE